MNLRRLISCFLAFALGLPSANAYTLEQSPEQIEAVVLLGEDGTLRCRIGQALELDDLRECDESDAPESGEISLGTAVPPIGQLGKAVLFTTMPSVAVGGLHGCLHSASKNITGKAPKLPTLLFSISSAGFINAVLLAEFYISTTIKVSSVLAFYGLSVNIGSFFLGKTLCNEENEAGKN